MCSYTNPIFGKILFLRYDQIALSQSDCRIFKSTICPEQIHDTASFYAWWYRFTKLKDDQKIFGWTVVSGLNLNIFQKWNDGRNWFFACWYELRKAKSWFNNFGVGLVKKWPWPFSSWNPKIYYILINMNCADYLNADSEISMESWTIQQFK